MNHGPKTQRGVAFYLAISAMAITLVTVLTALHATRSSARKKNADVEQLLKTARDLVLQHGVQVDLDTPPGTRRLGEWLWFPDLPIAASAGADTTEPNLDGWAEVLGCASRTWVPGQPVRPVAQLGANARCFGQIPWRTLGLHAANASDRNEMPWIVLSPNLAITGASGCWRHAHPAVLTQAYAGYGCNGFAPYPWLRVVDERGNLLSDRVAIALIAPGPALPYQRRTPDAGPTAYLDRITILSTCPQPCQPGTYDHAAYDHPNNQPTTLIKAGTDARVAERKGFYATPYEFNDQLVYITIDEWFAVLEARARKEIRRALTEFHQRQGYYPFAAAFDDLVGACVAQLRRGRLPTKPGSCATGDFLNLPSWLTDAGWHHYFIYAVSNRCVRDRSSCDSPGLVVGTNQSVNALLISPGAPIQSPPFAPARGQAQVPLQGLALSSNWADWLDSTENATGLSDIFIATENQTYPNNDRLETLP